MKRTLLTLLTAMICEWAEAQEPSLVNSNGSSITDKAAFLRGTKTLGYNSLQSDNRELWRIVEKIRRENYTATVGFGNRFRSVTFGDSVACDLGSPIAGFWGHGGGDGVIQQWTSQGGAVPSDGNPSNYSSWTNGVFTFFDAWARTPGGLIRHLDASFATGTYIEVTSGNTLSHELLVHFLAKDSTGAGDASYGSFKLQYKPNHAGGWIDCTTATVSAGGGSVASGVINTDNNSATEVYAQARFQLPQMDIYSVRLIATAGRVRLCGAIGNAGGFAGGTVNKGVLSGGLSVNFAQGGRGLASHFSQITTPVMNAALGFVDPHVVVYKSANEWSLANYQTHWPAFASKIMTAAPGAVLVVCGSHPRQIKPTNLDADDIAVDDYLREWCAATQGAIFVDVRQNFPAFATGYDGATTDIDDLWWDGIHIYAQNSGTAGGWGGGEHWVRALVWETIRPACEFALMQRRNGEHAVLLPLSPSEIRLFDHINQSPNGRTGKLALTLNPRVDGQFTLRPADATYNGGTQTFDRESGMHVTSSYNTSSPNSLTLLSRNVPALTFAHNPGGPLQGFAVGIDASNSTNILRARSGYRLKVPWEVYGVKNGLIVEGRSDSSADVRLLGLDVDATDAAAGNPLWSWFENGTVVYEGTTNDANEVTFVTGDPTSDVTITTPANQTGTVCIFLGILADPPAGTIPAGAIYVDNSATGNAIGTWLYSGAAWTQLN